MGRIELEKKRYPNDIKSGEIKRDAALGNTEQNVKLSKFYHSLAVKNDVYKQT